MKKNTPEITALVFSLLFLACISYAQTDVVITSDDLNNDLGDTIDQSLVSTLSEVTNVSVTEKADLPKKMNDMLMASSSLSVSDLIYIEETRRQTKEITDILFRIEVQLRNLGEK